MSYEIRYTGTKSERLTAAYQDAVSYINKPSLWLSLLPEVRQGWYMEKTLTDKKQFIKALRFNLSFVGIQGLPVIAILRMAIYGKIK